MSFVLVMYIYAGVFAKGDSVAIHSIPMPSQEVCEREGRKGEKLVSVSAKEYRFICMSAK